MIPDKYSARGKARWMNLEETAEGGARFEVLS